ncbi:Dystrophin [Operophtera brumata]|uniref:Dystrophin n=1 Tax=Operophtera brumata TaxID=104452 RepID=A0A0L7LMF1_OPEBR|nr:Dystrophin [Operophtera brumata]
MRPDTRAILIPPLRLSSGVFARHQLSLSESSLSLDTAELEAVLADIYFAAEKEGYFTGHVDLAVDLIINLLLNTLLIVLSEESASDKWAALANCSADHNGCVSPKRLAALLTHVTALSKYLGDNCSQLQNDVDACFEKSAGMLGLTSRAVAEWGAASCSSTRWLPVVHRVVSSRQMSSATESCDNCAKPLIQPKPAQCRSFMKGMRRFFFCTKTKKRKLVNPTKSCKDTVRRRKDGKPAIFTSTVGKAALQELSAQFKEATATDALRAEVDAHWTHVSTQINRLKTLKDNLSSQTNLQTESTKHEETDRPHAFDLFSPILVKEKESKVTDSMKNQPRVLSLDSGNFSVVSKNAESENRLTTSGDAPRPVVHTSDSISTYSLMCGLELLRK